MLPLISSGRNSLRAYSRALLSGRLFLVVYHSLCFYFSCFVLTHGAMLVFQGIVAIIAVDIFSGSHF